MSKKSEAKVTLRTINQIITKELGIQPVLQAVRDARAGQIYFYGEVTDGWYETGTSVYKADMLTREEWRNLIIDRLRDNDQLHLLNMPDVVSFEEVASDLNTVQEYVADAAKVTRDLIRQLEAKREYMDDNGASISDLLEALGNFADKMDEAEYDVILNLKEKVIEAKTNSGSK